MMHNERDGIRDSVAILSGWSGLILILSVLVGVRWFRLGDFSFPTAMAYHGILIPAWMMLILAYSRNIELNGNARLSLGILAVVAAILTGVGSMLINGQGFSVATAIQVAGMTIAELTAIVVIIKSFIYYFGTSATEIEPLAWWTTTIALIAVSLATPLGHLAGAVKDFGEKFPIFAMHLSFLKLEPKDVVEGYIGSHSHQILAAFLAAGFAMPLIRKSRESQEKKSLSSITAQIGLFIMIIATIAQTGLYQYCAWFGWEPPDLFANEPNGLPLDDFILIILGVGMLLLIPALVMTGRESLQKAEDYAPFIKRLIAVLMIAYMVSVVAIGVYIEFHEQYFGHGENPNAAGFANALAYIRAHLLFGLMIIPALLAALLNGNMINVKSGKWIVIEFVSLIAIVGTAGTFLWTFRLNSLLVKITFALAAVFLLLFALQLTKKKEVRDG